MGESFKERHAAQQAELQGLVRRLTALTPTLWVVPTLVAANLIVFVIMWASGVDPFNPTTQGILEWGANYGPRTTAGEWWRLASCMFVHIGIWHIALNMFVLWDAGRLVERLLGNVGFLVMYVISGLAGSLASLAYHPRLVSAGASGAVFGVFGALLGFVALHRRDVSVRAALAGVGRSALIFIVANVAIGLSVKQIDLAAHLGGLGAGFLCGLAMSQSLGERAKRIRWQRAAVVAIVGAGAVVGGALALPHTPAGAIEMRQLLERVGRTERHVVALLRKAQRNIQGSTRAPEGFAEEIQPLLQRWEADRQQIARMGPSSGIPREQIAKILGDMKRQTQTWRLQAVLLQATDTERQVVRAFNAAQRRRRKKELSDAAFAEVIERKVLPPWRVARQRLSATGLASDAAREHVARVARYMKLREESWTLLARFLKKGDLAAGIEAREKAQAAEKLSRDLRQRSKSAP